MLKRIYFSSLLISLLLLSMPFMRANGATSASVIKADTNRHPVISGIKGSQTLSRISDLMYEVGLYDTNDDEVIVEVTWDIISHSRTDKFTVRAGLSAIMQYVPVKVSDKFTDELQSAFEQQGYIISRIKLIDNTPTGTRKGGSAFTNIRVNYGGVNSPRVLLSNVRPPIITQFGVPPVSTESSTSTPNSSTTISLRSYNPHKKPYLIRILWGDKNEESKETLIEVTESMTPGSNLFQKVSHAYKSPGKYWIEVFVYESGNEDIGSTITKMVTVRPGKKSVSVSAGPEVEEGIERPSLFATGVSAIMNYLNNIFHKSEKSGDSQDTVPEAIIE